MEREDKELIIFDKLEKITCFSFNRKDVIVLLSFYNMAFFICCFLIKGHWGTCCLIAFLVSLIGLFMITTIEAFQKEKEEEAKIHQEEIELRKKIREEYQRIHKLKQKHELLRKIERVGALKKKKEKKSLVTDTANPLHKVYFSYLNRFSTDAQTQSLPESRP